ncbi:hypothetical protein SCP_0700320 [Sparassis crispa]|uniref:Uncharacterized protein n=1 Tax=Sparassis crispa TaxID=139825 RepID=A0A401GRJ6_9APHY|nr:hypothetical protein SCP_0700320 [Sparassis crispa]GBE84852.1 hypothetical protein SCP_0700320 [Sparassis crispa]
MAEPHDSPYHLDLSLQVQLSELTDLLLQTQRQVAECSEEMERRREIEAITRAEADRQCQTMHTKFSSIVADRQNAASDAPPQLPGRDCSYSVETILQELERVHRSWKDELTSATQEFRQTKERHHIELLAAIRDRQ